MATRRLRVEYLVNGVPAEREWGITPDAVFNWDDIRDILLAVLREPAHSADGSGRPRILMPSEILITNAYTYHKVETTRPL